MAVAGLGIAGLIVSLYSAWVLSRGTAFTDPVVIGAGTLYINTWKGLADPKVDLLLRNAGAVAEARVASLALVFGFGTSLADGFGLAVPRGVGAGVGALVVVGLRCLVLPRIRRKAQIGAVVGFLSASGSLGRRMSDSTAVRLALEGRRWPRSDVDAAVHGYAPTSTSWTGGW